MHLDQKSNQGRALHRHAGNFLTNQMVGLKKNSPSWRYNSYSKFSSYNSLLLSKQDTESSDET